MSRWVKLSQSANADVLREARPMKGDMDTFDLPGVYVNETGTSYKVVYTAVERVGGRVLRTQKTRNFKRGVTYPPVHMIDFGRRDAPNALEAAWSFKQKVDKAAREGVEARRPDYTLDDVFESFLTARARRPKTEHGYRQTYRKHIRPTFGAWLITSLDVDVVEHWFRSLDATKPAARRNAVALLRSITSYALRRGLITSDPSRVLQVAQPGVRTLRPDEIPTREQIARLADEVGDRDRAMVLLLAYGGVRLGEAIALRVDRVDFEGRRITIDSNAVDVGGRLVFGAPKTVSGTRAFKAPRFLVDAIALHVERYPTTTGLVFSSPDGRPVAPNNWRKRVFEPAVQGAGLTGLHIHDLRHTAASDLAARGASAVEIAARLGHSSAIVTQRVYLHLLAARDQRLADLQDEAYEEE